MLSITVKHFLDSDKPIEDTQAFIYMFRDKDVVFYIGRSYDIIERINQHLTGARRRGPSHVGRLVKDNSPTSLEWTIELYTLPDCEEILKAYLIAHGFIWRQEVCCDPHFMEFAIDMAEKAFISHYRPCLNTIDNEHPSQLPERYAKHIEESSGLNLAI